MSPRFAFDTGVLLSIASSRTLLAVVGSAFAGRSLWTVAVHQELKTMLSYQPSQGLPQRLVPKALGAVAWLGDPIELTGDDLVAVEVIRERLGSGGALHHLGEATTIIAAKAAVAVVMSDDIDARVVAKTEHGLHVMGTTKMLTLLVRAKRLSPSDAFLAHQQMAASHRPVVPGLTAKELELGDYVERP